MLTMLLVPSVAAAQDHAAHHEQAHPELPDGWMAHFDDPDAAHEAHMGDADDGLSFEIMEPGWHITTGPSGIFYQHEFSAEGSYTLEAVIHLFDPGERRESFGVFFGGSELHDREAQGYTYFLVRRDGRYMIRERAGEEVANVQGWTEHDAVPTWEDREEGAMSVAYTLGVEAGPDEIVFRVNGEEVDRRPRGAFPVDGHFGLRVNHNLNLHVERIEAR
ncbi:MAG: hypothetical protein ACOCUZ_02285 [bacterium]